MRAGPDRTRSPEAAGRTPGQGSTSRAICRNRRRQAAGRAEKLVFMQTLDQNLQDLVKRNLISIPEARSKAANKETFAGG